MKKRMILHILNSGFGVKGNIGYRTFQLIRYSNSKEDHKVIARSGIRHKGVIRLAFLGILSRGMNLFRKQILGTFNNRIIEIWLWDRIGILFIRLFSPDIVHSWEYLPKVATHCRRFHIRYVQEVPILPMSYNRENKLYSRLFYSLSLEKKENLAITAAHTVISPSAYLSDYLTKFKNNVITIPFGAVENPNINRVTFSNSQTHTYIFVGNINLRKGFDILIKAWQSPIFDGDKLIVLGRRDKSIPAEYLKQRGIEYFGFQDPQPFYSQSDTFVFPSFSEGSAKVIYEAASNGLLCIVSAQSGSVIENLKDGIVLEEISSEKLINAMLLAKSDKFLRISAIKNVLSKIQKYTWKEYSNSVHNVYEGI